MDDKEKDKIALALYDCLKAHDEDKCTKAQYHFIVKEVRRLTELNYAYRDVLLKIGVKAAKVLDKELQ